MGPSMTDVPVPSALVALPFRSKGDGALNKAGHAVRFAPTKRLIINRLRTFFLTGWSPNDNLRLLLTGRSAYISW